jgi:hypothetical protein
MMSTCCSTQARSACMEQQLAFSSNITSQMAGAEQNFAYDFNKDGNSTTCRRRRKLLLPFLDCRLCTTWHYLTEQISSAVARNSGIYLCSGYVEIIVVLRSYYPHEYWIALGIYLVSPDKYRDRIFKQTTTVSFQILTLQPSHHNGRYSVCTSSALEPN